MIKNPDLQISLDHLKKEMPTYASATKLVNYVNLSMLKDPSLESLMVLERWPKFPDSSDGKMEGKGINDEDEDLELEEEIDLTPSTSYTPPPSPYRDHRSYTA
jgi:hypothetical protein